MTMRTDTARSQSGFTLIEVIVATVVAAMCLTALAGVFSGGMRVAGVASELSRASTLAQSLLASAGIEKPLTEGVESGTTNDNLNWTVTVADEPTDDADNPIRPPLLLKRITAKVVVANAASPERSRAVELTTLRAVPRPPLVQ
jgi:prepilin-type N-terminal cleavage/methylation domain-containing protein